MLTHDELVEVGRRWLLHPWRNAGAGHSACCLVLTEIVTSASETPDVIGWNGYTSIILECKTSVSDFRADAKKFFRVNPDEGMGRQRYYIAPVGVIGEDEVPEGWGFIEVDDAERVHVRRASGQFSANQANELRVLLSLLRRLKVNAGLHVAIRAYQHMIENPRATATFATSRAPEATRHGRRPEEASVR